MFDRSYLPPADVEFVLMGDTHYMLEAADVEFESRRKQTARAAYAFELVESLEPDFVVHMGDLVQEFPGSPDFETAMAAATEQLETLDAEFHLVAGNHDVGDKPDPTMPTDWVTEDSLAAYHDRFGRSWEDWERGGVRFVTLNSQLMNASLPAATEQHEWFEETLRAHGAGPIVVFLHLPPFIHHPDEPALGHYDAVGRPAREWFLDLVRDHPVERVFAGHSHFAFRNRIGTTRFRVIGSPAFTRPGFGELFSSCPPPEQGRDDRGKLGFYLVRVRDGELRLHHVRTDGETVETATDEPRLVTRTTPEMDGSPIGASLAHPLSGTATVPGTFPSAVRQTVHNDYPALSCLELGIARVRTPLADLEGGAAARALWDLRRDGVDIVGTVLADTGADTEPPDAAPGAAAEATTEVDEIEVRIPGEPWPTANAAALIDEYRASAGSPIGLSPVVPARSVPGKQHDRLRTGYAASELERVDETIAEHGTAADRVLCRVPAGEDPVDAIEGAPAPDDLPRIGAVDWLLAPTDVEVGELVDRFARAAFGVAGRPGSRLYVEPLREMDRTMDTAPGLLDRRCNPTPAFHAVRCLNTALFAGGRDWERLPRAAGDGIDLPGVSRPDTDLRLAVPEEEPSGGSVDVGLANLTRQQRCTVRVVSLASGRSRTIADPACTVAVDGTTLLAFEYGE